MNRLPHIYGPATIDRKASPDSPAVKDGKACALCGEHKAPVDFYPRRKPSGGMALSSRCKKCDLARKKATPATPEKRKQHSDAQNAKLRRARRDAIWHYSGGANRCACCGESRFEFLVLDHVHGGGNDHRKATGISNLPYWAKRNGWPLGFQVLCHNCNFAKSAHGRCPHMLDDGSYAGAQVSQFRHIGADVSLGIGTIIWSFVVVEDSVTIGEDCVIGTHTFIGKGTVIGDRTRIQTGVFIPRNTIIENDVFIGPRATLTDDKHPRVNNPAYHPQPPVIREWASIGAGAVILPGVTIGSGAMIGAGAVVTRDVAATVTAVGMPARALQFS